MRYIFAKFSAVSRVSRTNHIGKAASPLRCSNAAQGQKISEILKRLNSSSDQPNLPRQFTARSDPACNGAQATKCTSTLHCFGAAAAEPPDAKCSLFLDRNSATGQMQRTTPDKKQSPPERAFDKTPAPAPRSAPARLETHRPHRAPRRPTSPGAHVPLQFAYGHATRVRINRRDLE